MNLYNLIEELVEEIKIIQRNEQIKKDEIKDEWGEYQYLHPNETFKLKELEEKKANATPEEVEEIAEEIKNVRKSILEFQLEENKIERKEDELYYETKLEIFKLIKKKIIKFKKTIEDINEQYAEYSKNIAESSDSTIDSKSFDESMDNLVYLTVVLDKLDNYNGGIDKSEIRNGESIAICKIWAKDYGLNVENTKIVTDLYKIITHFQINMSQEIKVEEEEFVRKTVDFEAIEMADTTLEVDESEEVEENQEEIKGKTITEGEETIAVSNPVATQKQVSIIKSADVVSSVDEIIEEVISQENDIKLTGITMEEEFMLMCEELSKNEPTEEQIEYFYIIYNSLEKVDRRQKRLFTKIIRDYNAKVEFSNMANGVNDHYTVDQIALEVFGKPYKVIASSNLVAKINKKRLVKNMNKALDDELEEETQNYYRNKANKIMSTVSSNYVISGAIYYANINKLSNMKFKLQENEGRMLSAKFERKLNKVSKKVAKIMSKELQKLTKKEILSNESLILILDQYLELLSICNKDKIYIYHAQFESFLAEKTTNEIYKAYSDAAQMILDYRKKYDFIPYNLKKTINGVVYNEIEDIIEFYDDAYDLERAMYIKS